MLIKTNVEGLLKDTESGAILNVDNKQLQAYNKQKKFMEERVKDSQRIQKVEKDLSEIKTMLNELIKERTTK